VCVCVFVVSDEVLSFSCAKCLSTLSPKAAVHMCRTNPQESI
jgi:hypothetical protein